jgi:hypothetical protein
MIMLHTMVVDLGTVEKGIVSLPFSDFFGGVWGWQGVVMHTGKDSVELPVRNCCCCKN